MYGCSADGSRSGRFPVQKVLLYGEDDDSNVGKTSGGLPGSRGAGSSTHHGGSSVVGRSGVVVENVTGQLPGELSVKKGDHVFVVEAESEFWYR
jgi:hypothetical protein